MNSLQQALQQAFPQELEQIAKDERRRKFEAAAERGRRYMTAATAAVTASQWGTALSEIRRDRYACACFLAKENRWQVRRAFEELQKMEDLLALKSAERSAGPPAHDQASKEAAAKELAAQRAGQNGHVQQIAAVA